jgi:hypothetical protein
MKLYCIDERGRSSVIWTIHLASPMRGEGHLLEPRKVSQNHALYTVRRWRSK